MRFLKSRVAGFNVFARFYDAMYYREVMMTDHRHHDGVGKREVYFVL